MQIDEFHAPGKAGDAIGKTLLKAAILFRFTTALQESGDIAFYYAVEGGCGFGLHWLGVLQLRFRLPAL